MFEIERQPDDRGGQDDARALMADIDVEPQRALAVHPAQPHEQQGEQRQQGDQAAFLVHVLSGRLRYRVRSMSRAKCDFPRKSIGMANWHAF